MPVTWRCFQVTWVPSVLSSFRKSFAADWATVAALNYFTQERTVTMIAAATMTMAAAKHNPPMNHKATRAKNPILKPDLALPFSSR